MSFARAFMPIALSLVIALVAIIGSLFASFYVTKEAEKHLTSQVMSAYVENTKATLGSLILDNSWWNDAFRKITLSPDPNWVYHNFGQSNLLTGPIHGMAILENDGTIQHQFTRDQKEKYTISQKFISTRIKPIKKAAFSYPDTRPEPVFFNGLITGSPALFALSPITYFGEETKAGFPADKRDFLLFWYIITDAELTHTGDSLGLTNLRLTDKKNPVTSDILSTHDIKDPNGTIIASLAWTSKSAESNTLSLAFVISVFMFTLLLIGGYISFKRVSELVEELKDAKTVAENGHKIKSDFLATMSHELRTPLNSIIGFSDILRLPSHDSLTKTQQEYIGHIQSSGNHLLTIINEILDMSKIEAGKYELHEVEINLKHTLHQSIIYLEKEAADKTITLVKKIPEILNEFVGDEKVLRQLFINLLSNAIKFTLEGGQVIIGCTVTNKGSMEIFIEDNGIGISPEKINLITEPYQQDQDHKTRSHQGTGLGLAISKAFVELHQGTLDIQSTLNVGTRITLTFPAERVMAEMI